MSISSLRTGAIGISAALDNNYMEPIASTLVGAGGTNSIIFNDIPQTYKHLQVRLIVRTNRASAGDVVKFYFNSDTSSSYSWHGLGGDGASPFAYAGATQTYLDIERVAGNNATASVFGTAVVDILDYQNTNKFKTTRSLGAIDNNGSGELHFMSGCWQKTDAINTITMSPGFGTLFNQYSRFSLYGIKG